MRDRSVDPLHHEQTLYHEATARSPATTESKHNDDANNCVVDSAPGEQCEHVKHVHVYHQGDLSSINICIYESL